MSGVRIVEDLGQLGAELDALGAQKVLVITTAGRRFVDRLELPDREVAVFDGARVHVPSETVEEAERRLANAGADTVVALGGGSAIGLGKALRRRHDVRFVAIPTTFSGSELTDIWGTTTDGQKRTGRDPRVRPDVIVHDARLFASLPARIALASLLNALAHPLGALGEGTLEPSLHGAALEAARELAWSVEQLSKSPGSPHVIHEALRGVRLGASVLDRAKMGPHHHVAHVVGGAFGLEHAAVHAALLPHSLRATMLGSAELAEAIASAMGTRDAPGVLYDALVRSGNARSLAALGVEAAAFHALASENAQVGAPWVADAYVGRRPSLRDRRMRIDGQPDASVRGPELARAGRVVVALHGRGADAGSVLRSVADLFTGADDVSVVAPQAESGAWYPLPYHAPLADHGAALEAALSRAGAALVAVLAEVPAERVFLYGFSQGACLAAELFARTQAPLAGLVAPSGARIGLPDEQPAIRRDLTGIPVILGVAEHDRWLRPGDVTRTAEAFAAAGASVTARVTPGDAHAVTALQRLHARRVVLGDDRRGALVGFGNTLESEVLPGALPLHQNTPIPAPYGLFAEHISGTGFSAPRCENRHLWLYRIRPSAQHTPFTPAAHPTLTSTWGPAEVNLCAFEPLQRPDRPTDVVDGLVTLGGAGSASLRRGFAVHVYSANASMDERAFCNADGDLLFVPFEGRITFLTECGVLEVGPGHVALLPRGMRWSALLPDGVARGYVAEPFGRSFDLPERGPVGANGLADARHFHAPRAWYEDRLAPGYRVTTKLGGELFQSTQAHSPYDVVAWSGNHVPFVYDLMDFSPIMNGRVDHIDPSAHTVLHAPLDEPGASGLAFVLFSPRWDVAEHTFRPPYFHRNVITEINGIVSDPTLNPEGPFEVGGTFVTPSFTPHGVLARGVERVYTTPAATKPSRLSDASLWFQFETTLPLHLTEWARNHRIPHWPERWGAYRSHFEPAP